MGEQEDEAVAPAREHPQEHLMEDQWQEEEEAAGRHALAHGGGGGGGGGGGILRRLALIAQRRTRSEGAKKDHEDDHDDDARDDKGANNKTCASRHDCPGLDQTASPDELREANARIADLESSLARQRREFSFKTIGLGACLRASLAHLEAMLDAMPTKPTQDASPRTGDIEKRAKVGSRDEDGGYGDSLEKTVLEGGGVGVGGGVEGSVAVLESGEVEPEVKVSSWLNGIK